MGSIKYFAFAIKTFSGFSNSIAPKLTIACLRGSVPVVSISITIIVFYCSKPGQFAAGLYPAAKASSLVSNQIMFSSLICFAPEHAGR
jgi:hypothetical protein